RQSVNPERGWLRARRMRASISASSLSTAASCHQLGTTKPAANTVAAYRRDLEGMARRIAADAEVGVVHLEHLTKEALQAAFASWADDHAAASVLRAHSSWSGFFDFVVAEDLVEGNPMAAVGKPRREAGAPRAIRDPDAAARLLATAAQPDPRGRDPWPERDLALAATFCVTGIREGEAVALGMGSLEGTPELDACRWWARGTRPGPSPSRAPWRRCWRFTW
ncbi:MAG: site-specific integrase, partial [Actinomycetota bacterium]|nr:site-specific integrase [Actinomycetota bacterium]